MKKTLLTIAILVTLFGCKKNNDINITPSIDVAHTTTFIIDTNRIGIWIDTAMVLKPRPDQIGIFSDTPNVNGPSSPLVLVSMKWYKTTNNYYRIDLPTISQTEYQIWGANGNGAMVSAYIQIVNGDTVYNRIK